MWFTGTVEKLKIAGIWVDVFLEMTWVVMSSVSGTSVVVL